MGAGIVDSSWPAPAKINLFLHVIGRRPDGYHDLQTAFQFLDLCDELNFDIRSDGRIRRTAGLASVPAEADLVVRAAARLKAEAGTHLGVDIAVTKRVPEGGGLGGGSSDAATTLVALNALWRTAADRADLTRIGVALGADVPVFIHGVAAWGEGIGERLTAIEPAEGWAAVIHPDCTVGTAAVFNDPDLTRNTAPMTIADLFSGRGHNDCEAVVRRRFPPVAAALDWLGGRGGRARLSGTGASVFALYPTRGEAASVVAAVPPPWRGYLARVRNRSALLERLARAP